jgi:hypothetical protein
MLSKGENPDNAMRKAIEEAEKKREAQEQESRIAQLLPVELPWTHIHGKLAYRADASLHLEVKDRAAVDAALALLPAVPRVMFCDGCVSFIPEERLTDKEREAIDEGRATVEGIAPYTVESDGGYGYGTYHDEGQEVSWYARVGPYLLDVSCKVTGEHWQLRQLSNVQRNQEGEIKSATVTPVEGTFRIYRYVRYATGDYVSKGNNRIVLYYPPDVPFADIAKLGA